MNKTSIMYFLVLVVMLLGGCRDDIDKYYDRPDYLRGNAYEFLKEKGNYTYFIQALEMTKFKDALDGRGLYSVFAPDDEAFKRFLSRNGKSSLQDFKIDSLKLIISYHLVEFSFNSDDFDAFTATASAEEPEEGDGTCYKFETLAQEAFGEVVVPNTQGKQTKTVFNQKKFLPIISTTLLKTQESTDYEGDYKMFFPEINWQGDHKKLYVANAAVVESGVPIDNGYIYLVDEVIDLLPTVYQRLSQLNDGKSYDVFRSIFDKFASFSYDPNITKDFAELGDSLFMFYHYLAPSAFDDLPDLACEWTVFETTSSYEDRLKYAVNCFAPNDDVLKEYIRTFWGGAYNQDNIPHLNLYYLLKAHAANRQTLILPSKIDQGLEGEYGEMFPLERKNIETAKFCSNGVLYGVDQVFEPAMFSLVMQPLFKYERFSTMLNIAHKQGVLLTMVDPEREFTIFTIEDDVLAEKYGYDANLHGNPTSTDWINGRVVIKRYARPPLTDSPDDVGDKTLVDMGYDEQSFFINNHISDGYIAVDQSSLKRQYHSTKAPYRFIYTEGGNLYGENETQLLIDTTWIFSNYKDGGGKGIVHELKDKFGHNRESVGKYIFSYGIDGKQEKFKNFYLALLKANLITLKPDGVTDPNLVTGVEMPWLGGERVMVFAPTDDIWQQEVLPNDSLARDRYLKFFFVPMVANKMGDYILPNYGVGSDNLSTFSAISSLKARGIGVNTITNNGYKLRVSNTADSLGYPRPISVETDGDVPFFATDGLVYGINGMLPPFPFPEPIVEDEK